MCRLINDSVSEQRRVAEEPQSNSINYQSAGEHDNNENIGFHQGRKPFVHIVHVPRPERTTSGWVVMLPRSNQDRP